MAEQNINQNLDELENDIITAKTTLAKNLSSMGAKTEPSVTLTEMANNVNNIPTDGGLNFATIGYNDTPQYLKELFDYSQKIYNTWDTNQTDLHNRFENDNSLVWLPNIDTSKVVNMDRMFLNCKNLTTISALNTSSCTNMNFMFAGCELLEEISTLDTSKIIDANSIFSSCKKIKTLPVLDLNSCHNSIDGICKYCENLNNIELKNTSNINRMTYSFCGCKNLKSIKGLNTSSCTNMDSLFAKCSALTSILDSNLDCSKCTSMNQTFANCHSLTNISPLNTSNCEDFFGIFYNCENLERIESIDFSSATDIGVFFGYCEMLKLGYFLIKNLGKSSLSNYDFGYPKSWGDNTLSADAKQSLIDSLLTYSYDRKANGLPVATIKLSAQVKERLTAEEITQIEAKGYIITIA